MNSSMRCVEFSNRQGYRLRGMLHEPDASAARDVCILLLSPGIKGRVGPHRLYLKIAAGLVPLGFHVLRFDFHGLGDSEAQLTEHELADVYNQVHGGRYVSDVIDAMDWMQSTYGISRFVGSGLCGGSITALMTGEADRRIESILGIGLPTVLEGGPENWARYISAAQASTLRTGYLRKLLDPRSLLRFLAGKSSYGAIFRVFRLMLQDESKVSREHSLTTDSGPANSNPRFATAFLSMLETRRPMMLIFSENDRLRLQFAEHFERPFAARIQSQRHFYQVQIIPKANHVLSDRASVCELLKIAESWLASLYPSPQANRVLEHRFPESVSMPPAIDL